MRFYSEGTSAGVARDLGQTFEAYEAVARSIGTTGTSSDPLVVRTSTQVILRLLAHHAVAFEDVCTCPYDSFVWTACGALTTLLTSAEMDFDDGEDEAGPTPTSYPLNACVARIASHRDDEVSLVHPLVVFFNPHVLTRSSIGATLATDGEVDGHAHGAFKIPFFLLRSRLVRETTCHPDDITWSVYYMRSRHPLFSRVRLHRPLPRFHAPWLCLVPRARPGGSLSSVPALSPTPPLFL